MNSSLRHQKEEIASATLDTKRELAGLYHTTKEKKLHLCSLRQRDLTTDAVILSGVSKLEIFLRGLCPGAIQPAAMAPHAARTAPKTAALQPPVPAAYAAHTSTLTATSHPLALAPPAV